MRVATRAVQWNVALLAALAIVGAAACDDGTTSAVTTSFSVSVVEPGPKVTALTCRDDVDRETDDVLEFDVTILVTATRGDVVDTSVRLFVPSHSEVEAVEQDVPASGRVIFGAFPLPLDADITLQADLIGSEGQLLVSALSSIGTSIDPDDPLCSAPPPVVLLRFVSPEDGHTFGAADDGDANLANGLQIDARVEVEGAASGTVELAIAGAPAASAEIADGTAEFEAVALPIGDGRGTLVNLTASMVPPGGELAEASIDVRVDIEDCALDLTPVPSGDGCDVLADADIDPDTDGVQLELGAQTNCARVEFIINDEAMAPIEATDGAAALVVSLAEGQNTISARAFNDDGLEGTIEPIVLEVDTTAPTAALDLDAEVPTLFGIEGNTFEDGTLTVVLAGRSEGLGDGDRISIAFDPPVDGNEGGELSAGIDGSFTYELSTTVYACDRTATVEVVDRCGNESRASYPICLDPVQPLVRVVGPDDGTVFTDASDLEGREGDTPDNEGLQVAVVVEVVDSRPADVDYEIFVECQRTDLAFRSFSLPVDRIARSELVDGRGTAVVTFRGADIGEIRCRGRAEPSPNVSLEQDDPVGFIVVRGAPSFELTDPRPSICLDSGNVLVGGRGADLDENGAALTATFFDGDDAEVAALVLIGQGDEAYGARLGDDGAAEALADGNYRVGIDGSVRGGLGVEVTPNEAIAFVVDTTAPQVALVAPAHEAILGVVDDANRDLADCVQTTLAFSLVDANSSQVCYRLNGADETCLDVEAGAATSAEVTLLNGNNAIDVFSVDCAGNRGEASVAVVTDCGNLPRLQVVNPASGSRVALAHDLDADAPGLQIEAQIDTNLPEGTEIELALTVAGGDPETLGPFAVDADGDVAPIITVVVPEEVGEAYEFALQASLAGGGSSGPIARITVVTQAPEIALDVLEGCVNGTVPDASANEGFQLELTASTVRVEAGRIARLTAECEGAETTADGVVGEDGTVEFDPIDLSDDADCVVVATIADAAAQEVSDRFDLQIDRVPPAMRFTAPEDGGEITRIDDRDQRNVPEAEGIQYAPALNVCGAAGEVLTVSTDPALFGPDDLEIEIGEGPCDSVELPEITVRLGGGTFDAEVSDVCGNVAVASATYAVVGEAAITIRQPQDGGRILANSETHPEIDDCQTELRAEFTGLGAGAQFEVCTDVEQGAASEMCGGGRFSALRLACVVEAGDDVRSVLRCPLTLARSEHTLSVVGRFGEVVESPSITVRADCEAPSVVSITVPQAGDDGCVNRRERTEPGRVGNAAAFFVDFQSEGIEEGVVLELQSVPDISGPAILTEVAADGTGRFEIDVNPGVYNFFVTGADAVGNRLPGFENEGVVTRRIEVETVAPTPTLDELAEGVCLNADDSDGPGGMVYAVTAMAGGQEGETLSAQLVIDDGVPVAGVAEGDLIEFPAKVIGEGVHTLAVVVSDDCGNVGSVAGFELVGDVPDWEAPLTIGFRVDTVPPVPTLSGVDGGSTLTAADDANGDASDGFQLDLALDFDPRDGVEAGRDVRVFTGEVRVVTSPVAIIVPEPFEAPLDARVTLPPGPHALSARAADVCGNLGRSESVEFAVQVEGCTSSIKSFAVNPAVLGPDDGVVDGDALRVSVSGDVDLLDPDCATASVLLVLGGAAVTAAEVVGEDGEVTFDDVALPLGASELHFRVTLGDETTDSLLQEVVVDLTAPSVTITSPGDAESPAVITQDVSGQQPGVQTTIGARVDEALVSSHRTAVLFIDGVPVVEDVAVDDGASVNVSFAAVTVPEGLSTLRICVSDGAGNEGCAERDINVDPAAPDAVIATAEIVNPRRPIVDLTFVAPGDDGAAGDRVMRYEVRRADEPIEDEEAWGIADELGVYAASVDAGAEEILRIEGALEINAVHWLAVRAVDEVGRLGILADMEVDLSIAVVDIALTPRGGGAWAADADSELLTNSPLVRGAGDVNGDGRDDLVASTYWADPVNFVEQWQATIVHGTAQPDQNAPLVVELLPPIVDGVPLPAFGYYASGVGDLNRDGLADVAVVGYTVSVGAIWFSNAEFETVVAIYFGTNDPVELANADVTIRLAYANTEPDLRGIQFSFVAGVGNFTQPVVDNDVAYDDLVIGGDREPKSTNHMVVVAGRADGTWPLEIDATAVDGANGVTQITTPVSRPGQAMTGAGDLDGDGLAEIAFSAGGGFDTVYVFKGQAPVPDTYAYAEASDMTVELAHPCPPDNPEATTAFGSYLAGGADLTGDGAGDFLVGDRTQQRISSWGAIDPQTQTLSDLEGIDCARSSLQRYGTSFDIAGDVNDDGALDLIVTHEDEELGVTHAELLFNNGSGAFGIVGAGGITEPDARLDATRFQKLGVAGIGDFDNDGFDDLGAIIKRPGGDFEIIVYY